MSLLAYNKLHYMLSFTECFELQRLPAQDMSMTYKYLTYFLTRWVPIFIRVPYKTDIYTILFIYILCNVGGTPYGILTYATATPVKNCIGLEQGETE